MKRLVSIITAAIILYPFGVLAIENDKAAAIDRVELLGVGTDDTFKKAKKKLNKISYASKDHSMGNPPIQYSWTFKTNFGRVSIYSAPYPTQPEKKTLVSTVVLEAEINDYSYKVVRKLYDDYKSEYSRLYGHNSPETFDLGSSKLYRWTWNIENKIIEIEYLQQENKYPYSTKIKIANE